MTRIIILTITFILFHLIAYKSPLTRLQTLNNQLNLAIHKNLTYTPIGYINCRKTMGGLNNQLEQLWFLNILSQRTNRGLVEKPLKLINEPNGPMVNLSEIINRDKYFSNLATVREYDYVNMCGPYTKTIKLAPRDWLTEDQMEYMIDKINSTPEHICINLEFFPDYKFFARPKFVNWIPNFNELVLHNFEFSSLIKSIAEDFAISNGLEDGKFITVQFRRGDFKEHCKTLFNAGYEGWAFNFKYKDKFGYDVSSWDDFKLHCYPEIGQFVERISQLNKSLDIPVNKILLMTNANPVELSDLKDQFSQNKFELIRFEPKLDLIPEGVKWTITHSLAIEMELGIRGKYFIGNRHSSIASNLLGLRGIDKKNESNYLM